MRINSVKAFVVGMILMLINLGMPLGNAQESQASAPEDAVTPEIEIHYSPQIQVGKAAIFDVKASSLPEGSINYRWNFGEGGQAEGDEVVHFYSEPGEYTVKAILELNGQPYLEEEISIFVYKQIYLFLTDQKKELEKINSLVEFAKQRGVFVELINTEESASGFVSEESFLAQLNEALPTLREVNQILIWTQGSTGLNALSRLGQSLESENFFSNKEILVITDQRFRTLKTIAEGTFRNIHPLQIVLTRPEALWVLFEQETISDFLSKIEDRGIDHEVIDDERKITPLNALSYAISTMVEKGVPSNTLLLILMLPVIATMVAFFKQVVGLSTMGVYTPSIITLSFIALDIKFGLFIFVVILLFGSLGRFFLRRYRLLYIPRMSILLSMVSLLILGILFLGAHFDISRLVSISVFPMLIMSTMVEKFITMQSQQGIRQALIMMGSTLLVSSACYFVVEWSVLKTLILAHPEVIFLFLIANIFLGRWTGLRLLEYIRFREIFRYSEEE